MALEVMEDMEYSIHPPSPFIECSWQALLPDWSDPVLSVLILLQRSPVILCQPTVEAEAMKQQLRKRSLQRLRPLIQTLHHQTYQAALFDPRTGLPFCSTGHGCPDGSPDSHYTSLPLNDVAVVHAALGYARQQHGQCYCIIHPVWGTSVYPTIVLTSATPAILHKLAQVFLDA